MCHMERKRQEKVGGKRDPAFHLLVCICILAGKALLLFVLCQKPATAGQLLVLGEARGQSTALLWSLF